MSVVPIVDDEQPELATRGDAVAALHKPFDLDDFLVAAVDNALEKPALKLS